MSIFKRQESSNAQAAPVAPAGASAAQATQAAKPLPPYTAPRGVATAQAAGTASRNAGAAAVVAPPAPARTAPAAGVVPPAAGLMFEMTPAESTPRVEVDTGSLVAEKVKSARNGQQSAQERVRIALQRARTVGAPANAVRRSRISAIQSAAGSATRPSFDPVRCAQAGLLNLAWSWQLAGAPIRAIHAYMQVLDRYPDTPAAAAAVADLVELSDILADEGQFHIALAIYDQLEQLL